MTTISGYLIWSESTQVTTHIYNVCLIARPDVCSFKKQRRNTILNDVTGVKMQIREVIYNFYESKTHFTLDTLKEMLKNKRIIRVSKISLLKLLKHFGKDCSRRYLCEKMRIVQQTVVFLRKYMENYDSNLWRVVFIDETWVFSNGSVRKSWQNLPKKSVKSTVGKRFFILHTGTSVGFIPGASLIFSTTNKSMDYHNNMNCDNFEEWIQQQLLPNLEEPSLILMDNASYHTRQLNKQPTCQWKKHDIAEWLTENNIPFRCLGLKEWSYGWWCYGFR